MTRPARSMQVFGFYLGLLGLGLTIIPNLLLTLFGFSTTAEPWIRVLGFVVVILAHYYLAAAYAGDRLFMRSTIIPRLLALPVFAIFVWAAWAPANLLLFALPDVIGALWTRQALSGEAD
ncbi:MAG: hypothetical protein SGJ01_15680 [Gemmatimonadota bacterium]|nr:hypothetical protein [Gemmatimonadota bacterium]